MKKFTLTDKDIFAEPNFPDPDSYILRNTVKAIVKNKEGKYGFVTNPVHGFVLLAGGGAESVNFEREIQRECEEELGCKVNIVKTIGISNEYRNRNAIQYTTTCFLTEYQCDTTTDRRTGEEKENGLQSVWLTKEEASEILKKQVVKVQTGKVAFYNTAFNIVRDHNFWVLLNLKS